MRDPENTRTWNPKNRHVWRNRLGGTPVSGSMFLALHGKRVPGRRYQKSLHLQRLTEGTKRTCICVQLVRSQPLQRPGPNSSKPRGLAIFLSKRSAPTNSNDWTSMQEPVGLCLRLCGEGNVPRLMCWW